MIAFLTKNIGWRLLSLGLAVLIWVNVASEPEMATVISVPVQYKGPNDDLEVSSRLAETVQIETRGPSGRLRELALSRTAVVLDFGGVTEAGERTFNITRAEVGLPRGVEMLRATPSQLRFRFERRARKQVPVQIRYTGTLPAGVEIAGRQVTPETVEIVGPESKVGQVSAVLSDLISLSQVKGKTAIFHVPMYIAEPEIRFAGPSQVTVKLVFK